MSLSSFSICHHVDTQASNVYIRRNLLSAVNGAESMTDGCEGRAGLIRQLAGGLSQASDSTNHIPTGYDDLSERPISAALSRGKEPSVLTARTSFSPSDRCRAVTVLLLASLVALAHRQAPAAGRINVVSSS